MSRTMGSNASQYFNNNQELRDKKNKFVGWYRYVDAGHIRFLPAPGLSIHDAVSESLNLVHDTGYDVFLVFNGITINVPCASGDNRDKVIQNIIAFYLQNFNKR